MHLLLFVLASLVIAVFAVFGLDTNNLRSPGAAPIPSHSFGASPKPTSTPPLKSKVLHDVPFVAQAPTGNWADPRQQDGCEEAAAYMAYLWATGQSAPVDLKAQEVKIQEISDWEEENYGNYHDTDSHGTAERIFKGYFKYDKVQVVENVTVEKIKRALSDGNLVQVPADGQILANPNYTAPGPERHNLLIIGYDDAIGEFVTNDNGTRRGKSYHYDYDLLLSAIRDYPTGYHEPILAEKKTMIIIKK